MLVLSRRVGQSLVINGTVEVTFVSMKGDRIRLGVEAPRDVSVHRKEVEIEIRAAELAALNQVAAPAAV